MTAIASSTINYNLLQHPDTFDRKDKKEGHLSFLKLTSSVAFRTSISLVETIASTIAIVVDKTFDSLGRLASTTNDMAWVCRKLYKHVFDFAEHISNGVIKLGPLSKVFDAYVGVVDVVQIAADIDGIAHGKFKSESFVALGKRVSLFVANIAGALMWFQEMAFINLSKTAASLGNFRAFEFVPTVLKNTPILRDITILKQAANSIGGIRVFGILTKVSALNIALRAVDMAYAFMAVDAAQRLARSEKSEHKIQASLDLSNYLAELALSAVLFAGVTNIVALGVMGIGCITLGLSAFFYRISRSVEIEEKLKKA
ncbi:MAG: hypothetical protein WCF65_04290 [Parachlamydiaceae bacterium]